MSEVHRQGHMEQSVVAGDATALELEGLCLVSTLGALDHKKKNPFTSQGISTAVGALNSQELSLWQAVEDTCGQLSLCSDSAMEGGDANLVCE